MLFSINHRKVIWFFFKEHWSNLLILLFAGTGIIIRYFQNKSFDIQSLTLLVLSLIAVSQLSSMNKIKQVLEKSESEHISAEKYLLRRIEKGNLSRLRSAKTIDLIGVNLKSSFERWHDILKERIAKGSIVRVLIMDPKSEGLASAIYRSNGEDEALFNAHFEYSLRKLKRLKQSGSRNDSLTVKVVKYPPSFAMVLLNDEKGNASGFVKLYGHDGVLDGVYPHFELYPWREDWWHNYFVHQFQVQWDSDDAIIVDLE